MEVTTRLLADFIATLTERDGWPARKIHMFGFSQGGTAALHTVQRLGCACSKCPYHFNTLCVLRICHDTEAAPSNRRP